MALVRNSLFVVNEAENNSFIFFFGKNYPIKITGWSFFFFLYQYSYNFEKNVFLKPFLFKNFVYVVGHFVIISIKV